APVGSLAQQPAPDGWIGKRVVKKFSNFPLRTTEGQPVVRSGTQILIYRVMHADGGSLWLQAEKSPVSGRGRASQFVPVEQAIAFFADRIRSHPGDVFPLLTRVVVWLDQKEFDLALADANLAVSLEPKNPRVLIHRGIAHF